MLTDEPLDFKCFQANKVLEHITDNVKQNQQLHAAKMLLLELSCIHAISQSQPLIQALMLVIH